MKPYCFIAQPFDGGAFDQRYEEIIVPAVKNCGLEPYRVDYDSAVVVPVKSMEEYIANATFCIADITLDNPNVWYELGYALALNKEVIMVCEEGRKDRIPFDVRHRNVLIYKTNSYSDFVKYQLSLEAAIKARLGNDLNDSEQNMMTPEEMLVLKFVGRDQMTTFAITPEEKILRAHMDSNMVRDCLKALVYKRCLEYSYATDSGNGYYHITIRGESMLRNK